MRRESPLTGRALTGKEGLFSGLGRFWTFCPYEGPFSLTGALTGPPLREEPPYGQASYGKAGPSQEAPYEEGRSLREGPVLTGALTGRPPLREGPITGRLLTRRPPYELQENLREATGRDFTRIGRNFRLCAVDQKRPFFPRAGPFSGPSAL